MKRAAVDFETRAIQRRPVYPPEPVGAAIWISPSQKEYLAWSHPTKNNCTKAQAKRKLLAVYAEFEVVYHHAEFDLAVGSEHLGLPVPKVWHDTMFLAFLNDPREEEMGLKELAAKYLKMPPEERDRLQEWILANTDCKGTKADPWGAHIAEAPGDLAGRYAIGDVERTIKLFNLFYPKVRDRGMLGAYDRERKVMPIFAQMSNEGLRINVPRLKRDLAQWRKQQAARAEWIRKRLKQPKTFNEFDRRGNLISSAIDSGVKLADAMEEAGKVKHWIYTAPSSKFPEGQRSTSRDNLLACCADKKLMEELTRYGVLGTYMGTFALPWLEVALEHGRIYPSFNQVRGQEDGRMRGTRTGRPSSNNPNLFNVPRNQEDPLLPNMRNYIIPDEGCCFLIRDYNQQELRITAHYEEGRLYLYYHQDPRLKGEKNRKLWADAHVLVQNLIHEIVGTLYPRKDVKIVNFGVIYGMGAPGISIKTKGSIESARALKSAHGKALPGVVELAKSIQRSSKRGEPIITWGGREYYVEEPKVVRGKYSGELESRDFHYKQLNYLIQGSAADCTKEAMIRSDAAMDKTSRLVLQVYDELVAQCEIGRKEREMERLKEAMESIEFDVPMLSDGKMGLKSWGEAKDYED